MSGRGHQVTILSAQPGKSETFRNDGYTTLMKRRLWQPWMEKAGLLEFHLFFFTTLANLPRDRYDVVLCSTFMDAYAASLIRSVTGVPCVFLVNGLPPVVPYYRIRSFKGKVFQRAMSRADEVISVSRYMQTRLRERFGRGGVNIPPPVDLEAFPLSRSRDHSRPIILCTAALNDYRKGGRVLMRAFDRLKSMRPQAVLQLSSQASADMRHELIESVSPQWRDDVQFLGAGELRHVPALYGRAAISVLPSLWEPYGLAMLESLAAGAPVVGTRDGAIPEILTDPMISRLFEPGPPNFAEPSNAEGLAEAMAAALDLSRDPNTAVRCRRFAENYSWPKIGPQFEDLLARVAAQGPRVAREQVCASF
jgi:glycosyltransferase involved in cell wall biosynthesis